MPHATASVPLDDLKPMLLTPRKAVPRGAGWLAEIKFDGYRALALTGSAPSVRTKNGADCTAWFPELHGALGALAGDCVLDGEICVLDSLGRADFERLHSRALKKGWYEGADRVVFWCSVPSTCSTSKAATYGRCRSRSANSGCRHFSASASNRACCTFRRFSTRPTGSINRSPRST